LFFISLIFVFYYFISFILDGLFCSAPPTSHTSLRLYIFV
jgi:hypothetical protein